MLNDVLKLANRGLSLIPIAGKRSGDKDGAKRPTISWQQFQTRLPNNNELDMWFGDNALNPKPDVAVVTGPISKVLVLDVDSLEGLKELADAGFNLPMTWTVKTKRGWHYYFRWVPSLDQRVTTKAGIKPSVDVRGEGGYVIAPPSLGYNGTPYQWEHAPHLTPLAVPPEWLINLLPAKGNLGHPVPNGAAIKTGPNVQESWLSQVLSELKEGNRNATFTRVAGSLRARGYAGTDIFELLKGKAVEVAFPLAELEIICRSVGRYTSNEDGQSPSDIESFLSDIQVVEWLVPSIIARRSIGFIAGLPETGKTWIMIDLAVECARGGGKWMGRFDAKPAKVLFIDQERFKGETQRRFRAVIAAKNIEPKELRNQLFIRCGTTTRINLENSYQAFHKYLADIRPDIVIVDSFVAFHTVEENNRGEIQGVLERIKQLRNEFGCTFVFIDHENKGAFHAKDEDEQPSAFRMAGSIAKPAVAEFVLTIRRHDPDTSMVYHTKSTLASTVGPFNVAVRNIEGSVDKIKVEAF